MRATGQRRPLVDPCTGTDVRRRRRVRLRADVDDAVGAAGAAFDDWRATDAVRSRPRARCARRRAREPTRPVSSMPSVASTGKPKALMAADEIPPAVDQICVLRGRGAHARRQGRGRIHGRAHVVHPARADRRVRAGEPVELPADDGRYGRSRPRWRPGTRVVLKPAETTPETRGDARRDRGRVLAARCVQRRVRRPRLGSCARSRIRYRGSFR